MDDRAYVLSRVKALRPSAKFVAYSHSSEFTDEAANLGQGYHYVNLYDEDIDSSRLKTQRGQIIVHNTYISSFAYNLFSCWRYCHDSAENFHQQLAPLIKHNLKKFYAEQLLHKRNNIFARALLLETLLYEQQIMIPVINKRKTDSEFDRSVVLASQLMSSVISFHEMGHFYLLYQPAAWDEIVGDFPVIQTFYPQAIVDQSPTQIEEIRCDIMSVVFCLSQYTELCGRETCLRLITFSYAVYAVMFSLRLSAEATVAAQRHILEQVDFSSIKRPDWGFEYVFDIDIEVLKRCQLMLEFCQALARDEGLMLFSETDSVPLPTTILPDFMHYMNGIMDTDDQNARAMALLVAEAFHEHSSGMQYLYLNSKVFTSNRQELVP